ncbi:MAG TPA: glycoside hydrolase family 3 C-terminal domain-containing protein [Ktedonobacterales bacterium]
MTWDTSSNRAERSFFSVRWYLFLSELVRVKVTPPPFGEKFWQLIDNWTHQIPGRDYFGRGSTEVQASIHLEAGRAYLLSLDFAKNAQIPVAAVRLGCLPPVPADSIERAARLAAASDVAIVCAGFGGDWQSEGFDRSDMELPGQQNALIEQVAAANPRTIVVLNTGSPISMPWLKQVAAVLEAWYPGQECGHAIADVLFGDVVPSGKLPQTFPARLEDTPAYLNFPGENGKVYYGEGLYVGYRHFDKKRIAPLFPFGFGLSYTTFSYSPLWLSAQQITANETLQVAVDVTNTGLRAGKEIVQLYVRDTQSRLERPEKELKAFAKVQLEPGERKTVTLTIGCEALAYYDDLARAWVAEAGTFEVLVGASSQDIRATAIFVLTDASH